MNPIFEDFLWLSGLGVLFTTGILSWLGIRLYQKANPDTASIQNALNQLPMAKLSVPLWVKLVFYLPLGLLGLWLFLFKGLG